MAPDVPVLAPVLALGQSRRLDHWTYPPIDETERAAEAVRRIMRADR